MVIVVYNDGCSGRSYTRIYSDGAFFAYNMTGVNEVLNHEACGHGVAKLGDEYVEPGQEQKVLPEKEKEMLRGMFRLTTKPVIYAANISENDIGKADNALVDALKKAVAHENAEVITICAQVEEEIAELSPEEKQAFIEELGIGESGLDKLVKACYKLLGLISYLTAGPKEVRAWTIERGTKAPQAAGKIHTDFERGFIRAEVVPFETLKELGSMAACKEKGLIRSEGKDYVMQDGDVVVFRFNV